MSLRLPDFSPDAPHILRGLKQLCILYVLLVAFGLFAWYGAGFTNFGERDFIGFWSASRLTHEGTPQLAYDAARLSDTARQVVPTSHVTFHWPYPPPTLLLYWPLSLLPCDAAWAIFVIGSAWLLLALVRRVADIPLTRWATLASPAMAFGIWSGQNALLNAALMGLALLYMQDRPRLSGLCAGLLTCKLHMAPLVFLVALLRFPKALGWAIATVLAMAALATLVMGASIWQAWLHSLPADYFVAQNRGLMATSDRMASLYTIGRSMGFSPMVCAILHAALALLALGIVIGLWQKDGIAFERRAAAVPLAALLVTPYIYYYDYALVLPALAFWMAHIRKTTAHHGELHLMALVWALPTWLGAGQMHRLPLPQLVLMGALVYLWRRKDDAHE